MESLFIQMMYTSQYQITLMTGFVVHILISTKCYAVYSNYRSFTNVMFMMYLLSQQVYICLISLCFLHFLYCIFKCCSVAGDFSLAMGLIAPNLSTA